MQKNAEDYTENDLMTIDEYKKATAVLNDQRMKYKKMLEEEKTKIQEKIKKEANELDNTIFNLFQTKMRYDSVILQESLKIKRLLKLLSDRNQWEQQIERYKY